MVYRNWSHCSFGLCVSVGDDVDGYDSDDDDDENSGGGDDDEDDIELRCSPYLCVSAGGVWGWCGWGRCGHSGCRRSCASLHGPPCAAAEPSGSGTAWHTADRTLPCLSLETTQRHRQLFQDQTYTQWGNWITQLWAWAWVFWGEHFFQRAKCFFLN